MADQIPVVGFYESLGSVDRDLFVGVMDVMCADATPESTQAVRYTIHQLTIEVDRDRRKRESFLTQQRNVERLIALAEDAIGNNGTAEMRMFLTMLRTRCSDLQARIHELASGDKLSRRSRLRQMLMAMESRASSSIRIMEAVKGATANE